MQMRQTIYLKSKCNFAVLLWNVKREVWQVSEFCKFGIDAICIAQYRSLQGDGKMVMSERGAGSVLVHKGEIVDFNWREWEVIWKR